MMPHGPAESFWLRSRGRSRLPDRCARWCAAVLCAMILAACTSRPAPDGATALPMPTADPGYGPRGVYINIATVLDARSRNAFITKLVAIDPDIIVVYGMHRQMRNTGPSASVLRALRLALPDARLAVSGETAAFFASVAADRNLGGLFDVFNYEFEFWNPGNYGYRNRPEALDRAASDLAAMRALADQRGIVVEMYLGWFDDAEAARLFPYLDRILLHAYVPSVDRIAGYIAGRLAVMRRVGASLGRVIEWRLLLSAETRYLGGALRQHGLGWVEAGAEGACRDMPGWSGLQWFTAELLAEHLDL